MPNVVVIGGPNGAGKSTLAPILVRDTFGITEYLNADVIAEGLSAYAPEKAAIDAVQPPFITPIGTQGFLLKLCLFSFRVLSKS